MNKNRKAGKFMKNKVRYQSKTDLKLLRELHHLSKECVATISIILLEHWKE